MRPLTAREGQVIATCAAVAVLTVLVLSVGWRLAPSLSGDLGRWWTVQAAQVPECAALAAVVLTARAFVGVGIAAVTAFVSVVASAVVLTVTGIHLGVVGYVTWVGAQLIVALAFLAADLMALRLGRFTPVTGGLAGLAVAVITMVISALSLLAGSGTDSLHFFPASFWVQEYALRPVALVVVGAVAGMIAEMPQWARAVQPVAGRGAPPLC